MNNPNSEILERYKKQLEEDRLNESEEFDLPATDDDREAVKTRVKELQNDPNDMEVIYKQFMTEYKKVTEDELDTKGSTVIDEDLKIVVKRAYCPNCNKEIVSKVPLMFNPYTLEKIAKYECTCGAKYNFDHSYPRLVYMNSKGEEIKVFSD